MKTISLTVKLQICNFDKICEMTDWTHTDAKPLLLTSILAGFSKLNSFQVFEKVTQSFPMWNGSWLYINQCNVAILKFGFVK